MNLKNYIAVILFCCVILIGCRKGSDNQDQSVNSSSQDSSATETSTGEKSTFNAFLAYFDTDEDYSDWPQKSQWPLVQDPSFFTAASVKPLLASIFKPIPPEDIPWIPLQKIQQLEPHSTKIAHPERAFDFYAFRKVKLASGWLLGIYAQKTNGMENNEYNAHPFLMVTYSIEGKVIDDYCWWWIEDDDLQVWTDIAVQADTLMVGRKKEISDLVLSEVYSKVILDRNGKFKTVYSNFPEASQY